MDADVTLDTVGLYCPVPVMLATEKIKKLEKGKILEILADDSDSLEDIPNWSKITGNKFLKVEKNGEIYKFYVQKEDDFNPQSKIKKGGDI
ncbi:sulfurtransferase TusA family protein [bacterium]|nr:sulfurtransferase TusA family protein [bacterium]